MQRLESSARGGTGSTTSAAALGRTFEESVSRHLRQAFGAREGFRLEDVHATGHSGDLLMIFDGLRILVELKSYDPRTRVPTKEVEKLARDLAEVQPRCNGAIMISACSEITGHYSCGPIEVSSEVACVPVLFINNFLTLGEPQITLHMTRVFLTMVGAVSAAFRRIEELENASLPENRESAEARRVDRIKRSSAECVRRCAGYLAELNKQSADLLQQVTAMKNGAMRLRESVLALVETESARLSGLMQLMSSSEEEEHGILGEAVEGSSPKPALQVDRTVFVDPDGLSLSLRGLVMKMSSRFEIGNHRLQCPTKDILMFIQEELKLKSEKATRDVMKSILLESVIKHGFVVGINKKILEFFE